MTSDAHEETPALAPGTTVRLATAAVAERIGLETVPARSGNLTDQLVVPVRIEFDPGRLSRVSARVPGVIRSLAVDLGARVRHGQLLATLESSAAASTRAEIAAARIRLAAATAALQRLERLGPGMATAAQIEQARAELAAAEASLHSHLAAAGLVGAGNGLLVRLLSPRDGVVVARRVTIGQQVTPEDILIEVADVSTVWGILDIPDTDAMRVQVGMPAVIEIDGSTEPVSTTITWLSPTVDPHTRTVQARVELPNSDGRLRANAFGRARIALSPPTHGVLLPRGALHRIEGTDVVFVQRSPVEYEVRRVEIAARNEHQLLVLHGIAPDERVVTTGGFQLKSEILREALGDGCSDDH